MPLYEYECFEHGRFELLLPLAEAERPSVFCLKCRRTCPRVFSLVAMRPDPFWSGVMTRNYGYVTSGSRIAQIMKEKHWSEVGDRSDREAAKKTAEEAAKAREDKFAKDTRKFLENRLSEAGVLDSFGGVRPEAMKPLSSEPITRITKDDPRFGLK